MTDQEYPHQNVIENFKEQTGKPLAWLTTAPWSEFEEQCYAQTMLYRRQLDEVQEHLTSMSHKPQYAAGYPLKKLWDEARDLRWALADTPNPPDALDYHNGREPRFDLIGPGDDDSLEYRSKEESEQWVREVRDQRLSVLGLDAQLCHQYKTERVGAWPGTQIGSRIIDEWRTFEDELNHIRLQK